MRMLAPALLTSWVNRWSGVTPAGARGLMVLLTVTAGACLLPPGPVAAQSCLPADSLANERLAFFKVLFTAADTQHAHSRTLLKVPATTANKISLSTNKNSLSTNKNSCQQALRAMDSVSVATGYPKASQSQLLPVQDWQLLGNRGSRHPRAYSGEWGADHHVLCQHMAVPQRYAARPPDGPVDVLGSTPAVLAL
jgi:hypothetical protein